VREASPNGRADLLAACEALVCIATLPSARRFDSGARLFCDDHRGGMWRYEAACQSRPSRIGAPDAPGEWLAPAVHRSEEISKAFILFAKGLDGAEPTIAPQRPTL